MGIEFLLFFIKKIERNSPGIDSQKNVKSILNFLFFFIYCNFWEVINQPDHWNVIANKNPYIRTKIHNTIFERKKLFEVQDMLLQYYKFTWTSLVTIII